MSDSENGSNIYQDLAESILEHAEAIARLDADRMDEAAYESTYADHVGSMRSLAVPYVDPQPDFELVRKLKSLSGNFEGVFVHLVDGSLELIIDSASRQRKVKLWNRRQYERGEEEDETSGDWPR
ncbi:MAG: hypothetical protein M3Q42_12150 [Pseudomonadota bacterium]|nr:hypothetical protein [Pseudomonadota bacterium]